MEECLQVLQYEQLTKSRKKLYNVTLICTVLFTVLSCVLMAGFKKHEAFFDSHGNMEKVQLTDDVSSQYEVKLRDKILSSYIETLKKNVVVNFADCQDAMLTVPLALNVKKEQVMVQHEFTKNKYVITLKESKGSIVSGTTVSSDFSIMDAVGIYELREDVVIEIYCNDFYCVETDISKNGLEVRFIPARKKYNKVVIIYMPYEADISCLPEGWSAYLNKVAENRKIKLLNTYELMEDYTEENIVDYANFIYADALLGMQINEKKDASDWTIIYNGDYFIPDFDSIALAETVRDRFLVDKDIEFKGYQKCLKENNLIYDARVPAVFLNINIRRNETEENPQNNSYREIVTDLQKILENI